MGEIPKRKKSVTTCPGLPYICYYSLLILHKVESPQNFFDCFVLRHNRISHGLLQKQITTTWRSNLNKHSKTFKTFFKVSQKNSVLH